MKKIIIAILILSVSCTKKEPTKKVNESLFNLVPLTRPLMEKYIKILPDILQKSKQYRQIEEVQGLSEQDFNKYFYIYLYKNDVIAQDLRDLGFATPESFGDMHHSVLEAYLLALENPTIIDEAVKIIPSLEDELNKSVIRLAKEKNNSSLQERVSIMKENLDFYQNLVLIDQFKSRIQAIDAP